MLGYTVLDFKGRRVRGPSCGLLLGPGRPRVLDGRRGRVDLVDRREIVGCVGDVEFMRVRLHGCETTRLKPERADGPHPRRTRPASFR